MSLFWIIFILSWVAYAVFVGLTGFLLGRIQGPRLIPYVMGSGLILIPTAITLIDQHEFLSVGPVMYGLSMAAIIFLLLAWFGSWGLPREVVIVTRQASGAALLVAIVQSLMSPAGFFIPLLFFPDKDLVFWRLFFTGVFVMVSGVSFFWLNRTPPPAMPSERLSGSADAQGGKTWNWRLGVKVALALLLLFWLAQWIGPMSMGGLVNVWGEPGMSPAMLDETEILCSGHFSPYWQPFRWCWPVELKANEGSPTYGRATRARRKIVPFIVDHYWKGTGPQEIDVALFEPSERYWGDAWRLPAQENLLVALKKDTTGSGDYQLVNQVNSWLVITPDTKVPDAQTAPDKVIMALASHYLDRYAAGPEAQRPVKLLAPLTIDSFRGAGGLFETGNRSTALQTLATVKNFRMDDDATLTLLEKLWDSPDQPGAAIRQEVLATLIKIDPARGWQAAMKVSQKGAANGGGSLGEMNSLPEAITAESLDKIDPAQIQKLIDSDPRMAQRVSYVFRNMKDRRAIPWLGQFLSNPNWQVQYNGMGGLYELLGGRKAGYRLYAVTIFQADPEKYLAPYKAWWVEHRAEYPPLPSP